MFTFSTVKANTRLILRDLCRRDCTVLSRHSQYRLPVLVVAAKAIFTYLKKKRLAQNKGIKIIKVKMVITIKKDIAFYHVRLTGVKERQ